MKLPNLLRGFLFLIACFLAACGAKSTTLNIEMKEFQFIPDRLTVPAGSPVTLHLKNSGHLEHDFVIMIQDRMAEAPFDDDDRANVYWEAKVPAQEETTIEFTAPTAAGEYQIVCAVAGHLEQKMTAVLVVEP